MSLNSATTTDSLYVGGDLTVMGDTNVQDITLVNQVITGNATTTGHFEADSTLYVKDGKVGIGTESPQEILHIYDSTDSEMEIENSGTSWAAVKFTNADNTVLLGKNSATGNALLTGGIAHAGTFNVLGNNALQLATNNVARMTILGGGNVGIGTASPGAKLEVNGTSKFNGIINTNNQWISGDGGAEGISIDDSGNVGIGTSSPSQSLELHGGRFKIDGDAVTHSDYPVVAIGSYQNPVGRDMIDVRIDTDGVNTQLFNVDDGGNTYIAGNVGIGTTAPIGKLEINNGASGQGTAMASANELVVQDNADAGISILTPNTNYGVLAFGDPEDNDVGQIGYYHPDNYMKFIVNAGEKMRIDSSGNVGIGTASPGAKLEVYDTNPILRLSGSVIQLELHYPRPRNKLTDF